MSLNKIVEIITGMFIFNLIFKGLKLLFKRREQKVVETQMRFNTKKEIHSGHEEVNKIEWDLPEVELFDKEEKLISKSDEFYNSRVGRIKTFNEFINVDTLKLETKCGNIIEYNMLAGKFYINDIDANSSIENVTGLSYIGKSRIDDYPIISVKIAGDSKPLVLKVLLNEHRFQSIRDIDDYPPISNIDSQESMQRVFSGQIVNGKYKQ
jgi:hypothetical protein